MTQSVACPTLRELEQFAQGQLSEADAQALGQHIVRCSTCAQALAALQTANPLAAAIREAGQFAPAAPNAESLAERLAPTLRANSDSPPQRLGRYEILGRLGAGGMGVVYRAHDPQLGRDVAIKLPTFQGTGQSVDVARQRFLREARAAAAVRHAHACPIYDVGEEQGRPYVVMALIEGETLADRLRRQGRFDDPRDAVALAIQVADALAAVHAAGIVHRDLKPGNILLDQAGQPFLADFGLARAVDSEQLTSPGQLAGTPAYMSPEQASPELGAISPASDQYSLGVVLYEMLTGRRPFEGSATALMFQLGARPAPAPSLHRTDLDASLERVLLKALARAPRDRYPSVAELADALRSWSERSVRATDRQPREAQHRRLTLLQCGCDLFESPALLDALDPEEQRELLLDFQRLCRDVAAPLAGTVVRTTDNGLLIGFGIPFALERAAHRAVRAALNLLDRMDALNERLRRTHPELRLSARAAIHSDRAVVAEGRGRDEPISIVGQALPVVDQLERLASPGTVVISEDTRRLVCGFVACVSLGPQHLKGATGAKAVYGVEQLAPESLEGVASLPLVGRDREAALLEDRWEQAAEGAGQVVLVVGEAGIGKSRQLGALKDFVVGQHAGGQAALLIEWPCTPVTQNSSLFPATAWLERLLELKPQEHASQQLDKVASYLERLGLASAEAVALLASLLSIPLEGRYPALGMSPQRQKQKTFDLLLDWLRAQGRRQPTLFIVEDLHWADSMTLEFLGLLVGQAPAAGLLTALTFRPDFSPPWKAKGHHTQVSLSRLSRRQTRELMLLKAGRDALPQNVVDQVLERTDGVPLFVEELTAMILAAGAFDLHAIPATLQDLLMARLDRLASDLEIVQLAAVIGREFSYELLSAATSRSEEELQEELAKLVDAELLFQQGRPPQARYEFKHALIRDAAHQSLLKKKRQQLHLRVAEALEESFPETSGSQPELLAHHFSQGNANPKAAAYWEQAGERAQQRGAFGEALTHFRQALDTLRLLPETTERHVWEVRLRVRLGVALEANKTSAALEAAEMFSQAHALCLQTGLMDQALPALNGLLRHCADRGQNARAQELAAQMFRVAEQTGNRAFAIAARAGLGAALYLKGEHTQAVSHLNQVIEIPPTAELRATLGPHVLVDPWVASESLLSLSVLLLGHPDRSQAHSQRALRMAEELGQPYSLGAALGIAGWHHTFRAEREEANSIAARMQSLATEKGFAGLAALAKVIGAWALTDPAPGEQAVLAIREGMKELRDLSAEANCTDFFTLLAEAHARAGQPDEGLEALAEAERFLELTQEYFWQAEVYRIRAELLLQRNASQTAVAEDCFRQALSVARQQQSRWLELRAAKSLARLWGAQGRAIEAREVLSGIYSVFTEGFQTRELQQAQALLDQW